jgi:hypothetical protein
MMMLVFALIDLSWLAQSAGFAPCGSNISRP